METNFEVDLDKVNALIKENTKRIVIGLCVYHVVKAVSTETAFFMGNIGREFIYKKFPRNNVF